MLWLCIIPCGPVAIDSILSATTARPHLSHGVFSNACGQLVLHMTGCGEPVWLLETILHQKVFYIVYGAIHVMSYWQDVTVWVLVAVLTSILGCVREVMK